MKKTPQPASAKTSSEPQKRLILRSVLAQVPEYGWTDMAYEEGLKAGRIKRAEADVLMPIGLREVIRFFAEETDRAMQVRIAAERGFAQMKEREKVAFGVRARFEALAPHRESVKRLLVWYAMPLHAPEALKRIYRTTDLIWTAAGDNSTDYNFYTKRLLLAAVIKATMLFWLGDDTEGQEATWAFLDRRINEVVKAGKTISLMKEYSFQEVRQSVMGFLGDKLKRAGQA